MPKKIIGKGAEAIIYLDNSIIIKDRIKKRYRIKEIDSSLRKSRTKRETKILEKLSSIGFPVPKLIHSDSKSIIFMAKIKGKKLRDVLESSDYKKICFGLGKMIRTLHENKIIHGDLTTSNMIMENDGRIVFIDFGLGFFSEKTEDMAVDLHLMKQALDSSHYRISESAFRAVTRGYGNREVQKRLGLVELRGRNKGKS